jgi:hypothetical protein
VAQPLLVVCQEDASELVVPEMRSGDALPLVHKIVMVSLHLLGAGVGKPSAAERGLKVAGQEHAVHREFVEGRPASLVDRTRHAGRASPRT